MKKPGFVIETLHAFVSVDPKDGEEGVIGMFTGVGWLPLISADEERFVQYIKMADDMCKQHGIQYKILRFDNRADVTEEMKAKYGLQ